MSFVIAVLSVLSPAPPLFVLPTPDSLAAAADLSAEVRTVVAAPWRTALAADQSGEQQPAPRRINVNEADERELETVPGIGPAMARRIVEWRAAHGPFERIDDLLNVRGIGVKTLEKLRPYLEVRAETGEGR